MILLLLPFLLILLLLPMMNFCQEESLHPKEMTNNGRKTSIVTMRAFLGYHVGERLKEKGETLWIKIGR
jgi:hypothetical protein